MSQRMDFGFSLLKLHLFFVVAVNDFEKQQQLDASMCCIFQILV